jgi:hypothetical protein
VYPLELVGQRDWAGVVLGLNALLLLTQAAAGDKQDYQQGAAEQGPSRVEQLQGVKVGCMLWSSCVQELLL